MIMGGLSGGAARSLPDLGVLADGRKGDSVRGSAQRDASVTRP